MNPFKFIKDAVVRSTPEEPGFAPLRPDVVGAKYDAPLHNSSTDVMFIADAPQAAHVNYKTLVAMGELPEQMDFSLEGARAITDPINQAGMKVSALLKKFELLTPEVRERLTLQAEANLKAQTGQSITLDRTDPSAPFFNWADRSTHVLTSDGYAIMGLRSNATHSAIAQIVPPGIGWASVEETKSETGAKTSRARTPQEDAQKETLEEFGLKVKVKDLGYIHENEVEGFTYQSEDKSRWMPGIIGAFSYAAYVKLDKTLAEVVKEAALNDENFGLVAIHHTQFPELLKGKQIEAIYHSSESKVARAIERDALPHWSTERYMDDPTSPPAYYTSMIRHAAKQGHEAYVAAKASGTMTEEIDDRKSKGSKKVQYPLSQKGNAIMIGLDDFLAVGRNFAPEMVVAAHRAGLPVGPETASLAEASAKIRPVADKPLLSRNEAFGARADKVSGPEQTVV